MYLPSKSLEIPAIISTLMLCGLLTMIQREALLTYVDQNPEAGYGIALRLEHAAEAIRKEGTWIGAKAARQGLAVTVALQVSDLWRKSTDIRRNAQLIRAKAEQAIEAREQQVLSQEQVYPRAA